MQMHPYLVFNGQCEADIAEDVAKLKAAQGKDVVVLGSATLASFFLPAGLIDEYRVILNPFSLAAAIRCSME
jgi:dihydrofolate reductase